VLRRVLIGFTAGLVVLAVALVSTAPSALVNRAPVPHLDGDLTRWLAAREYRAGLEGAIIPGTEKRIRWYRGLENSKTPLSIVYLHGFSATRQEIAPVEEMVADALGANLFETRLSGHGLEHNALLDVRAEDWLNDAAEALSIGAAIGEKIILMGTSNGATLALAMVGHPSMEPVSTLVLLSPNFGPRDTNAEFLTWPGGPQLASLVVGESKSWAPRNELQARYWTTTYPMDSVIEMMRLVKYVRGRLPLQISQALLTFYSPADRVIDTRRMLDSLGQIESPRKQLIVIEGSGDSSNHVLAGNILAPENNRLFADRIVGFVLGANPQ